LQFLETTNFLVFQCASVSLKMGSEKFCLRWNDFESNISFAFRELRDDKDFFDVTLACEDEQIQAHKVILSACSPFFRNILRRNSHPNPLLYLKGVKYSDLQAVLNFMYHGEVNVAQEELNSFLAVAEDLRVKGLTQNQPQNEAIRTEKSDITHTQSPARKTQYRTLEREPVTAHRQSRTALPPPTNALASGDQTPQEEIQEVARVKTEPKEITASVVSDQSSAAVGSVDLYEAHLDSIGHGSQALAPVDDQGYQENYEEYQYGVEGQGYEVATMGEMGVENNKDFFTVEGGYQCGTCGKICAYKNTIKRHIIDQHTDKSSALQCVFCMKMYKNKNSLDQHRYKDHREHVLAGV